MAAHETTQTIAVRTVVISGTLSRVTRQVLIS
jgi:hypothetical protein